MLDYEHIFLNSKYFNTDQYKDMYKDYKEGKISENMWLKNTHALRVKENINVPLVINDFLENPLKPLYNPTAKTSNNKEYDYENLINSDGNRIYTTKEGYDEAYNDWLYVSKLYKIDQNKKEFAEKLGLVASDYITF